MHGPGKLGDRGKDSDIEDLLLSKEPEDVVSGIQMIDEKYRYPMARFLETRFPGFSPQERASIWEQTLEVLTDRIRDGEFAATGSVTGLLYAIMYFDAIDCLRRKQNWQEYVRDTAPKTDVIIRFDDPHDLEDLLAAINHYIDTKLDHLEQVVLRTYVRLLCEGLATETGRLSLSDLTEEVNWAIHTHRLSKATVRSLLRQSRRKLRTFLEKKGFFR